MKIANRRWIHRFILMFLVLVGTVGCASYPSDPRSPQVEDDTYAVNEDDFLTVAAKDGILANDKPREGTRNILKTVGDMETEGGGKVVLAEDGSFSYEPKANFFGKDQLGYTVENEKGKESSGLLKFEVAPLNDVPQAENDEIAISNTHAEAVDVMANDMDPDGDKMRIVAVNNLSNGQTAIAPDGSHILFTPQANHSGSVSFSYTIADAAGGKATAGVLLTSGNNVLQPDTITVAEDSFVTVPYADFLANDQVDASSDIQFSEAQNGTVVPNDDRTVTYRPNADFSGTDTFTYTIEIDGGVMVSTTVTVTVTPFSDAPTISDITDQTTLMSTSVGPIPFTVEDLDTPLADLTITARISAATPVNLVTVPNIRISGSNENRALWITPTANLTGSATITIVVSDGEAESSDTFLLTVRAPTPGPTISPIEDQSTAMNQATAPIAFIVNDDRTPPATLIVSGTSSNQTLVPNANITLGGAGPNRTVVLQPAAQQTGMTTITLIVRNGVGPNPPSAQTSFRLRVGAEPPQFSEVGPGRVIELNTPLVIPFTIQDPDTPLANLNITARSENPILVPNDGSHLVIGGTGDPSGRRNVTVTPATNQTGNVRIVVSASDGMNITNLRLNLQAGNNAPVIAPISPLTIGTSQEAVVPIRINDETPANLMSYDVNISATAEGVIGPITFEYNAANGTMDLHLNPPHQVGSANITLVATDVGGLQAQTQFQVTVGAVNTDPENSSSAIQSHGANTLLSQENSVKKTARQFRTKEDTLLTIPAANGLLSGTKSHQKNALKVTSLSLRTSYYGGEVKIAADGSFSYRPPANFAGQDHFQYTLGESGSRRTAFTQKAVIMVSAVNDAPLAADDLYGLAAGETLVLGAARGVLANDRDVEDQPLKVTVQHNSRLTLNADGSFSYAPPAGFTGKERFSYVVSDQRRRATATLTLMVGPNRAPLVRQDGYRVGSGQAVGIGAGKGLLANDKDPEERALSIAATGVFDTLFGGEVNIGPRGGFTYLPPPNFDGFDSFTYTVSDGSHIVTGSAVVSVSP